MTYQPIYLDAHSTTPVDPRVLEMMIPYFTEQFGNAASTTHQYGWVAETAVQKARTSLAEMIGAEPEEIIFTSGATEANNLAIKGVAEAYFTKGKHIITVVTEHNAVLDPCQYLASLGFDITILPVQMDGLLAPSALEAACRENTVLVSVMAANNEIGVLQPLADIGAICRDRHILFHTDAAQAIGKIPLDVQTMNIDLMSLTAHKSYGPKGIGALYVRRKNPRVQLAPQLHGGGHERGLRSGTLYTPQIVGFAKAIELALSNQTDESHRLLTLRQQLWQHIAHVGQIRVNGHPTQRLPGNLNVSVEGIDGQALLLGLQQKLAVSSGSACTSASMAPSHVLTALGHDKALASASIRFGIGRFNTPKEINQAAQCFYETVNRLRQA